MSMSYSLFPSRLGGTAESASGAPDGDRGAVAACVPGSVAASNHADPLKQLLYWKMAAVVHRLSSNIIVEISAGYLKKSDEKLFKRMWATCMPP